jgi:SanA protein
MILFRKSIEKIILVLVLFAVMAVAFVLLMSFYINKSSDGSIYNIQNVPQKQAALVLGARVWPDGKMSDMFQDRVDMAIDLYKAGKVQRILVSGDHGTKNYDEVDAAKNYLLANGIDSKDIFLDHAGFDTYDSVYRAKHIFEVQSMIIVTQKYHLPRALYIAKALNVDAVGTAADFRVYGGQEYRDFREKLADVKAWFDVIIKAKPKFLGPAVPIVGNSLASWGKA